MPGCRAPPPADAVCSSPTALTGGPLNTSCPEKREEELAQALRPRVSVFTEEGKGWREPTRTLRLDPMGWGVKEVSR